MTVRTTTEIGSEAEDGIEVPPGCQATVGAFVCLLTVTRSNTNPKGDRP